MNRRHLLQSLATLLTAGGVASVHVQAEPEFDPVHLPYVLEEVKPSCPKCGLQLAWDTRFYGKQFNPRFPEFPIRANCVACDRIWYSPRWRKVTHSPVFS